MTTGKINVSVDNIFPLIKKFLYSDHEIFLRELISNATDATLKLKHLASIGEAQVEIGNPVIEVRIDKKGKKNPHHGPGYWNDRGGGSKIY
jgi:molecular chaperone HtpG